jgi:hypothetical protein
MGSGDEMAIELKGAFEVTGWDEPELHAGEGLAKINAAHVRFAFTGGIEGQVTCEYLIVYRADGGAESVGAMRIEGTLEGRTGTFALFETGVYEDGVAKGDWKIVPNTGTGDLAGIAGSGSYYTEGHGGFYTLNVELGEGGEAR